MFHLSSHYHFLLVGILLERTNEAARRSIVTLAVALLIELLENLLGQHLAQLDTPLVEAVDVPDRSLSEGQVLVVDNQSTQLSRADGAANQDRSGRPVTKESLVRNKSLGSTLSSDLLVSLANHESLGLSKVVGGQHLLVKVVGDGVVRLGSQNEVGGDQLGSLVDKLEEGVLSVGARLTKEDGA